MNLSIHKVKSNLIAYFLILSHIFQLHLCSSNSNVLRIIGAVNRTVSIPCPVYNINDSIDLILWFRGNQESALYSLDARTTPIERAKQNPIDESFSRRAFIDVSKKPSALTISNIQKEDAGLYRCRVDFRRNRSQYRSIHLNVIDGPKEVTILDADSVILRDGSEAGPYNENGHLVLVCETEATDPPVSLHWYRNNELIDTSFEETEQRVVRNELTVLRLTREHLQNRFTCKATNSNLTVAKEATVILELNLRPLKVQIIGPKHPINAGERVTLVCESEGSRPNASISFWTRNENYEDNYIEKLDYFGRKSIKDSWISSTLISSDFSSKLTLLVNESYNNKQIICRAEHPILPDSAIEDVYTLNVRYPPKVSLTLGSSSSREQIYEKSNVTFVCHVNANPMPTSILWFFNDEPISKSNFMYHENGTELLIQNVNTEANGNFSCMAISESGNGVSDPVNLKVLYSPICSTERTTYGVSTLEPVEIKCKVDSVPPAHTFYWSLNSSAHHKPMPLHGFHNQIKGQMSISTLNYSAKTHLGYGSLLCYAVNSVGKQQVPCTFDIRPGRIPDKLNDCIVGNQSLSTLLIKCDPGSDGGLEQRFHLEVYRSGTGKLVKKMNSSTRPVFDVDGLPRSTTFVLILYSANVKGKSDTTTFVASTLPFPNKELIIITPLIAILMGVMACFACTAISIVIISKIKNPEKPTKAKYPRRKSSLSQPDTLEDDSTSNLSENYAFNNNQAINLKFASTNGNFHSTATSSPNELYNYTTLELAKDPLTNPSGYRPEHLQSLSNKRYIMITNQKSGLHQLNETASLPMDPPGVPINSDQSPINFLLFRN